MGEQILISRHIIVGGIILLFLLSTVSPMTLGLDAEKVDMSIQSADGPMDSPWPMKCHDTRHTGRSPYSTADNPLIEKWRFNCKRFGMVEGSIIIDKDGTLYFGSFNDYLYALYPNGNLKWSYKTGDHIQSTPSISEDGTIYVTSWDNCIHAVNPNGTRKWKYDTNANIESCPAIATDGTIYFGTLWSLGSGGKMYALNPDGTEKWIFSTGDAIISDPAIGDDGTIYFGSMDNYLYALYPNGTLRWQYRAGNDIFGHASIADDGTIYFGSNDGYLYALYPNGTLKWKFHTSYGTSGNPSIDEDGVIYVGTNKLYAILPDGTLKWSFDLGDDIRIYFSSPAISADGIIYVGTSIGELSGGEILAINYDGTELWRKKLSDSNGIYSSPVIAEDGTIYIGSQMDYEFRPTWWTSWGFLHAFGNIESNVPPDAPMIDGPISGNISDRQTYYFSVSDPDNNPIYLFVEWGDDTDSGWIGPLATGESKFQRHQWSTQGDYIIKAKVKDEYGAESDWATLEVTMPRNKANSISKYNNDNITIDVRGGLGITIEIKNNDDTSISLVNWSFILDCPLLFFGWTSEGSISEISPGASETIRSLLFGFGSIAITVQVNDIVESRNGFIIGPFVIFIDGGII